MCMDACKKLGSLALGGDCCLSALPRILETDEPVRRGYLVTSHAKLNIPAAVFVRLAAWLCDGIRKRREKHLFWFFGVSGPFSRSLWLGLAALRLVRISLNV